MEPFRSSTGLTVERIREAESLRGLEATWNSILDGNHTRSVELTSEWQLTHWKHFSENSQLFVLVVRDGDRVLGIAPLRLATRKKLGVPLRQLSFIAAEESNYQDFLIADRHDEVVESILHYLAANRRLWDVMVLAHVPESSPTCRLVGDHPGFRLFCRRARTETCIYLRVDKSWDEHLKALSKKRRAEIGNRRRRLEKHGDVVFDESSGDLESRSHLEVFFGLHRKRWDATPTPSQFNDARHERFYSEAVSLLAPKKQIGLFVLRAGEATVASMLCFNCDGSYLIQLIAHDPAYRKAAPSIVLHESFVREAFRRGVDTIDFGFHYPYKELWADRFKTRVNLELHSTHRYYWAARLRSFLRSKRSS